MVHSILLVHCWGFTSQTTGCRSNPHETTLQMDPEAMRAVNDAITACWGHLLGKTWQGPDFFYQLGKFQSVDFRVCAVGFQSHPNLVQLFFKRKNIILSRRRSEGSLDEPCSANAQPADSLAAAFLKGEIGNLKIQQFTVRSIRKSENHQTMISHMHHFPSSGRHLGSKQLRLLARASLVVGTHLDGMCMKVMT